MDEFLKEIATLRWWLGVVVVGILVNLVSPRIGALLGRSSSGVLSYWRLRSAKQRALQQQFVERLQSSEYERVMAATEAVTRLLEAMCFFSVGSFFFLVTIFPTIVGSPDGLFGFLLRTMLFVLGTFSLTVGGIGNVNSYAAIREGLIMASAAAGQRPPVSGTAQPPSP